MSTISVIKNIIKKNDFLYEHLKKIWNSYYISKLRSLYCKYIYLNFEKLTGYKAEKKIFKNKLGYELDLKNPITFNEKVVWKKIHNRNPLIPLTQDKHKVREYVRDKLGEDVAEDILIPLLYETEKPEMIPFEDLPDEYIIKPNNAAGRYIIKRKENTINHKEVIKTCKEWLGLPFGLKRHEWAYQPINPKILIEKLLIDDYGNIPEDYKFYVYNGETKYIQLSTDRHSKHKIAFYNKDWELKHINKSSKEIQHKSKPINLGQMIKIAETLAEPFNYVRVDLYNIEGNIFFGEITHYPASGTGRFEPVEYDYEFGSHWEISRGETYVNKIKE